ncbi:MAG: hypothetical protein PHY99_09345, partial [Bacteroidales bacterium]|nr:hypothetical protein [Bacteroidales bacterium]
VQSQEAKKFPFDPYVILKSWDYDHLIKTMGEGEEITATSNGQIYLAGLRYPTELLGMKGKMEFTFRNDSIAFFLFRTERTKKPMPSELIERVKMDTVARRTYSPENARLDSLHRDSIVQALKQYNTGIAIRDSLRRDSVVQAISEILGVPISIGRTGVTEKKAKYSALWINYGFSCFYKDYVNYSEIVFSFSTVPTWVVNEFGVPAGTEILHKTRINTKKFSWTASMLAFPLGATAMTYSDVYFLLEFSDGPKFLEGLPQHDLNYRADFTFDDYNGDAIPEVWVTVPADLQAHQVRHYLYSLQMKEPNQVFNSDEQMPIAISVQNNSSIKVTFPDGTESNAKSAEPLEITNQTVPVIPDGFLYLRPSKRNNDGSVNFFGGIEIRTSEQSPSLGILDIQYKHTTGGWAPDQIKLLKNQ